MKPPSALPEAVIASIRKAYSEPEAKRIILALTDVTMGMPGPHTYLKEDAAPMACGWAMDHYFIMRGTMYVGIELDGYMHT